MKPKVKRATLFAMLLATQIAVADFFFFEHLWWPGALAATIAGWVTFFLTIKNFTKISFYKARELDIWLTIAGDLRLTTPEAKIPGDNSLLSVGPGFQRVLGYLPKEMIGRSWLDFVHPDDTLISCAEINRQRIQNQVITNYCNRWRHKSPLPNGGARWVWLEWNAVSDSETQKTYANARDVTARFERESQLWAWARITNDLMAIENTSIPITERKFDWVNEAWVREFGWSLAEIYSMRIVDLIAPDDIEKWNEAGQQTATGIDCKIRRKTSLGHAPQYLSYEWSSVHMNGFTYATGRDVEMEQTHHLEMTKAISDLKSRNADLERFASVAAHQLRSPPRTIAGIADALLEDYGDKLGEEGAQFITDIQQDANYMAEIVDGLYRFSRVRTSADIGMELVDLNEIMTDVVEKRAKTSTNPHEFIHSDTLPVVLGDKVLLREVFANLIDNGLKFNESDPKIVEVSATPLNNARWQIVVSDNGIGINPIYHEKLFKMFERVHPDYAGSGVGLALVAAIIQKFGGSIRVTSEEKLGAAFIFDLEGAWIS